MTDLKTEIKNLIINCLNLEDMTADDIGDDTPLFVDGLGLDSIDALELGVAIKKQFNIMLQNDSKENRQHFSSVQSLADFISKNTK